MFISMPTRADPDRRKQMAKAITVKVATPKVIKALEARLEKIQRDYSSQEVNEQKYTKSMEAWRKEIGKWAIDRFSKAENIRTNYREWYKTLNVDFDITVAGDGFPAEPKREHEVIHQHTYKEMVEDITNALSILKMTDEETVNASTMKSIARYL
jgi:malate synthase